MSDNPILTIVRIIIFLLVALVSPIFGRLFPWGLKRLLKLLQRRFQIDAAVTYRNLVQPVETAITITGALGILLLFLNPLLGKYDELYTFLAFYIYLGFILSGIWLFFRVIRRFVHRFLTRLFKRWLQEVNELVVLIETVVYTPIILLTVTLILRSLGLVQLQESTQQYALDLARRLGLFLAGAVAAPSIGRSVPGLLRRAFMQSQRYLKFNLEGPYNEFIEPLNNSLTITGTLCVIALSLNTLTLYTDLYTFLGFFIYLALSISVVWLASRIAQRVIRQSLVNVLQRWVGEVNEVILVFETLAYVVILLFAIIIFAGGLRLNLIALGASLGISGIAVAFAAQQALERLIGTLELYLDRPYSPGEYIRVTFNPHAEDVYGRIESIGLRSTKIRTVAKNTLVIVPNSLMAGTNIENISRGKKIMAMVCLDFLRPLKDAEQALVKQAVKEASQIFWGLEQANTQIQFCDQEQKPATRARVIFFITGSSQNSLNLRKRLLELANDTVARQLSAYNLSFITPEPMIYIDSPMSI
jgi:MscS family membrane protein